ncbi:hypothetical protein Ndes2526B_g08833 [Nannochloris sp. 'desiccata']
MQALAAFRASQLQFLAPYTQWRPILSSQWPLKPDERSTPRSSPTTPPQRPSSSSSLVPVTTNQHRNLFPSLTDIVASAIHRLVLLVTSLNRASANEIYVRRNLQQIGIHPLELDLLSLHHPDVFRVSVRHSIEPVIQYLRSQGLTGSALAQVISRAPGVLSSSVEDQIMPLCTFLKDRLGTRGMSALLRYPPIVEISPLVLQKGFEMMKGSGASDEECAFFLREFPELFARFSTVFEYRSRSQVILNNGETAAAEVGGAEGGIDAEQTLETGMFFSTWFSDQIEQVLFYFRALKAVSGSGWDVKVAETELRMLIEALENRRDGQINK